MSPTDLPTDIINTAQALCMELTQVFNPAAIEQPELFVTADPALLAERERWKVWAVSLENHIPIFITGETGTGKEVIANVLRRPGSPFITVNCAAIPSTLIASILFGHARGAFTGAINDHTGAFIAAAAGTIFLDEIGDMPAELQPYLLRAVENRTVTPVGTNDERPLYCRIIAATNDTSKLRPDLRARLSAITVTTKPLHLRPLVDWVVLGEKFGLDATDVAVAREHYMASVVTGGQALAGYTPPPPLTNVRFLRACGYRKKAYGSITWHAYMPSPLA